MDPRSSSAAQVDTAAQADTGATFDDSDDGGEGGVGGDGGEGGEGGAEGPSGGGRIGRYIVLAELGSGGMGIVYRVWDPALDRTVALKVMSAGRFAGERQVARFLGEARAIARLDDPALVSVYELGVIDECPYFTMEYIEGRTLAALLDEEGPLTPQRAAGLGAAIARGLDHAHRQGVIHRDIKPANVLIDARGAPRVVDFGIARLLEDDGAATRTGAVLGTPQFMAPEQAEGRLDAISPATDVYGVAALVYHAVTGRPPHPISADRPLTAAPTVPRDLRAILHRALAAAPADRYPTAGALAAELARFRRGEPVEAALPSVARRLGWWMHRRRGASIVAATSAALALALVAAVSAWRDAQRADAVAAARAHREDAVASRLDEALAEARARRAAGDVEAAEAIEREVTSRTDVQQTGALARFHLARAADAAAVGDIEAALAAASTAYTTVDALAEQQAAMVTLGRLFVEARDAEGLAAVVATLARRFPDRATTVDLYARVFEGRLLDAADHPAAAANGWAPMLRALGRGTPTEHVVPALSSPNSDRAAMTLADVDGDGRLEAWFGGRALDASEPALPPLSLPAPPVASRPGAWVIPVAGLPGTFARLRDPDGALVRGDAAGFEVLAPLGSLYADTVAATDLDRDGRAEVYYSKVSAFRVLRPPAAEPGPWRERVAHRPTELAAPYIPVLRAVDLGEPMLLVGTAGWRAYDLRLYRGADDGGLTSVARRQVGAVTDAIGLSDRTGRFVVAALGTRTIDRRLFHPDDGLPLPNGLHVFELTPAGLTHRAALPLAPGEALFLRLHGGDLDGDGLADVVALAKTHDRRRYGVVFRRLPDGWAEPLPLLGVHPFAVVDVDGDGDAELLANDRSGRLWTLGAGDTPTPARTERPLAPAPGVEASAIEDLVAIGRLGDALAAWRREVRWGRSPTVAARRGAEIAERLGRYDDAAALHLRAADDPAHAARALRAAARNLAAARRVTAERDTLARLVERPDHDDPEAAARLAALDARLTARIELDFDRPLDPDWQIATPDRVRRDRGALVVRGDAAGELARLPLRRLSDRVAFEVELETPRVEYGGGVVLALVARLDDGREIDLARIADCGWGGGSLVYQRIFSDLGDGEQVLFANVRVEPTDGRGLRAYVEYDHARGSTLFVDRDGPLRARRAIDAGGLGDALAFVIRADNDDGRTGAVTEVRIERLTLDGAARLDPAAHADPAARLLADGRPTAALEALGDRRDDAAHAIRLAALYDLGRWPDADALLATLLDGRLRDVAPGSPLDALLVGRLRRAPLHVAPLVRAAWGARADALFWRVFGGGFDKHPADPEQVRAANAVLLGADLDPRRIVDHPAPARRLDLLLARARMRRHAGELGGARADLDAAAAALAALPPTDDPHHAMLWAAVRLERAGLDVADDPAAAAAAVRAALAGSSTPEIIADLIRADDALRRLRDDPVWAEVEAAATW